MCTVRCLFCSVFAVARLDSITSNSSSRGSFCFARLCHRILCMTSLSALYQPYNNRHIVNHELFVFIPLLSPLYLCLGRVIFPRWVYFSELTVFSFCASEWKVAAHNELSC
ncbi:uncharacterized protein DEA37_0001904 [Paragonimus westermani]|uniref:Secreted protein n=1 Tax=Paragonimus westermani TaxID=34504 RepID=A0A5J4NE81_9TREM|nr:uncharacterized protein DEA37_0001904 [Paragonimus westermani]